MADIFNDQRVLGVRLVADGTEMYNGLPTFGVVDVDAALFVGNLRTIGVDVLDADDAIHNDQRVVGAVLIADGRALYNNQLVIPVHVVSGVLA